LGLLLREKENKSLSPPPEYHPPRAEELKAETDSDNASKETLSIISAIVNRSPGADSVLSRNVENCSAFEAIGFTNFLKVLRIFPTMAPVGPGLIDRIKEKPKPTRKESHFSRRDLVMLAAFIRETLSRRSRAES
jgi:hypothetical protein